MPIATIASRPRIPRVKVLALEPDKSQAAAVRRIVHDSSGALFTVVKTKDALIQALEDGLPDLLLLPALLAPATELALLEHIRSLGKRTHFEVLLTPYLFATEGLSDDAETPAWRRWLQGPQRPPRPRAHTCDPRGFAEQLQWSLQRADQRRREFEEAELLERELQESLKERRFHRRFLAEEIRWLRQVRLTNGVAARLIDLSAGGVLLEAETRLPRESQTSLHLIGQSQEIVLPIKVVRNLPSRTDGVYRDGCVVLERFDIDKVLKSETVDLKLLLGLNPTTEDSTVNDAPATEDDSIFRRPGDHRARERRLNADEAPWVSNVRMPWGLEVDLLNISRTGMLVESPTKLIPGSEAEIEISGPETRVAVPARIVRSEVGVSSRGLTYRSAASFATQLPFPEDGNELPHARAVASLLNEVLRSSRDGEPGGLRRRFSSELRKMIDARDVTICENPVEGEDGTEAICFKVPSTHEPSVVLQATFARDHELGEAKFKFLQAAAAAAAVVLECERVSVDAPP